MLCFFHFSFFITSKIFDNSKDQVRMGLMKHVFSNINLLSNDDNRINQILSINQGMSTRTIINSNEVLTFKEREFTNSQNYFKFHSLIFTDCTFKNVFSQSKSSCIDIEHAYYQGIIDINSCRFINCAAIDSPGVIKAESVNLSISGTCIAHCHSYCCSMSFQSNLAMWCNVTESIFDEVAPNKQRGHNFAFRINSDKSFFTENNMTRCNVRERFSLGLFHPIYKFCYKYISNINCSSKIIIAFYVETLSSYIISDSLFYGCTYFQDKNGFLETDGTVKMNNCTFIHCKMMFKITKDINDIEVGAILYNCTFDIPFSKFTSKNNVDIRGFNLINKNEFNIPFKTNFTKWRCATDIPPPTKSPTPSPFPTPTQSPIATMKIPKTNIKDIIFMIENLVFLVLLFITAYVFIKIRQRKQIHPEEDEQLLPKKK